MSQSQSRRVSLDLRRRIDRFIRQSLKDIRVEAAEEFDRNFQREAFFSERWARRKFPDDNSRGLLVQTGALRRSIRLSDTPSFAQIRQSSVLFQTSVPYARIHNEGGDIPVTARSKRYFWYRYLSIVGTSDGRFASQLQRKKSGSYRNNRRNRALSAEAQFWRAMALKPVGSKIRIPRRQFIGRHPQLEALLRDILIENARRFLNKD